eukprot:gene17173-20457_t
MSESTTTTAQQQDVVVAVGQTEIAPQAVVQQQQQQQASETPIDEKKDSSSVVAPATTATATAPLSASTPTPLVIVSPAGSAVPVANNNPPSPSIARSASTPSAANTNNTSSSAPAAASSAPVAITNATSSSALSSSSTSSSPTTSNQNLSASTSAAPHPTLPSGLATSISLASSVASANNNNYHTEEFQFALENKKTLKRLLKISKHWTDSMKVYCQNCHLFTEEILKQSDQMVAFAQPKEKTLGGHLSYFGNTIKAVNSVHDQMLNEIQDVFCTPVANFVDYDFAEVVESHKRVTKSKEDYEGSLGKISASIKKSKTGIDEQRLMNYEAELEKLKDVLENHNRELEIKLDDLAHKNETKYLKSLLLFINAQYLFFNRGAKLFGNLKPRIEEIERYLEEIQPPKVVEGHLMKKSKQVMGGWNKCWYVLKDGMLYCYKGKKEFHPENALNILLCSVRVPQQLMTSPSSTNPPAKEPVDYRFEILHPRKKLPIVLQSESEEERDRWVEAIQEAISNSLNSQPLEKSSSISGASLLGKPLSSSSVSNINQDEVNQQVMRILQRVAGNNVCADCSSPDPDWASINLGIIICKVCSGVHRSLGTHISKVRSLTLDKWSPENILYMKEIGNAKFNILYEHQLSDATKPSDKSDRMTKEAYIRAKYKTKDFIIKSTLTQEELSKMLYEMASSTSGPRDVMRYIKLMGQGADVNYFDQDGRSSLHQVVWKSDDVVVPELLLQNGADITMMDSRGWTPMHYSAFFNRPRCTYLLMRRGFDAIRGKCADHLGRLAIDVAVMNRSKEAEQVLRGEDLPLGLTLDNIEANTIPVLETSVPVSTDFPLQSSREEILSEDEDDEKYMVGENEIDSQSWSENESVGRASFSANESSNENNSGHQPSTTNTLTTSNNSNGRLHEQNLTVPSSNNNNSNNSNNINSSSNNLLVNLNASTNGTNNNNKDNSKDDKLSGDVPVNSKLNRPKSKRRPSLLGRGRNTLRLMKSKLTNKGSSGLSEQLPATEEEMDETEEYDEDDENPPSEMSTTSSSTANNKKLTHKESMDNVYNRQQLQAHSSNPPSHTNSSNELVPSDKENGSAHDDKSPSRTSPTPFKLLMNKFKGITSKKNKEHHKEGSTDSSVTEDGDIPDDVSVGTNTDDPKSEADDTSRSKKEKKEKKEKKDKKKDKKSDSPPPPATAVAADPTPVPAAAAATTTPALVTEEQPSS